MRESSALQNFRFCLTTVRNCQQPIRGCQFLRRYFLPNSENMVHCAVPGCHITGGKGKFSKDIKIHPLPVNAHRARLWMKSIPRDWHRSEIKKKSIGVCSLHFVGRVKSDDPSAPNYTPTIFPTKTYSTKIRTTKNSTKKNNHSTCSMDASPSDLDNMSDLDTEELTSIPTNTANLNDHLYTATCTPKDLSLKYKTKEANRTHNTQHNQILSHDKILQEHDYITSTTQSSATTAPATTAQATTAQLTQHIHDQDKQIQSLKTSLEEANKKILTTDTILNSTECRQWTGLPTFAIFEQLLRLVMATVWLHSSRWCGSAVTGQKGHVKRLAPPMQLLLTLVRIKTGSSVFHLSMMFGVSDGLVSEIFTTWITMLYHALKKLFHLPPKHKVFERPAPCYRQWKKLAIVIDCTEIFIESPKKLKANKEVFSNYKHHDTAKFLVGTSPNMCVIYISDGWGGRASDKTITLSSEDLLGWLKPGETVMSDKGFLVGQELAGRNIKLLMPPFKGSDRSQFTNLEIEQSENVSKARVHVERLIGRIKTFEILQGVVKLSMLDLLPKIVGVCSYLVNLQATTVRY